MSNRELLAIKMDPSLNHISRTEMEKMVNEGRAEIFDEGNRSVFRLNNGKWTYIRKGSGKSINYNAIKGNENSKKTRKHRFNDVERYDGTNSNDYLKKDYGIWHPEKFLETFHKYRVKRPVRTVVYATTLQAANNGYYFNEDNEEVILELKDTAAGTKFYKDKIELPENLQKFETEITVDNRDTLDVAYDLINSADGKTAVLNMASFKMPGGGVLYGTGAQEESLFRRTDYYRSLYAFKDLAEDYGVKRAEDSYPLVKKYGGVYSPDVTVFRGNELSGYPFLDEPWTANFIAVAAIKNPMTTGRFRNRIVDSQVEEVKDQVRAIFNIAIDNEVENLVLGAFGCGAYNTPPKHMAELFKEILEEPEYKNRFNKIVFAIVGDKNYYPFKNVFN